MRRFPIGLGLICTFAAIAPIDLGAHGVEPSDLYRKASDAAASGNLDLSISLWNRVLELEPTNALAYAARGTLYALREDYTNALTDLNRAALLNPDSPNVFRSRALILKETGDPSGAIKDFTTAI